MTNFIIETSAYHNDKVTDQSHQLQKAKKTHPCLQCFYAAGDSSNLNKHVRAVHDKDRKFLCPECKHRAADKCNLDKHVASVHRKERPFKCPQCNYKAWLNSDIKKHIRSRHEVKVVIQCDSCEYCCSTRQTLEGHIKSVHLGTFDFHCDVVGCGFRNNHKPHMMEHVKSVHYKVKHLQCDRCDFKASQLNRLTRHIKEVHDKVKDHKCENCNFATSERKTLILHIKRIHQKIRNYLCDRCDYKSFDQQCLNIHAKKHEDEDNLKKEGLECHFCKRKDFETMVELNRHVGSHRLTMTIERKKFENRSVEKGDLVCQLCGGGGFTKLRLKDHLHHERKEMRREGEEEGQRGILMCGVCGKDGLTQLRLKWHMVSHDDEEGDFACSICESSDFKTGLLLRRHIRSHKSAMAVKKEKNAELEKRLQVDSSLARGRVTGLEKKGTEKRRMLVEEVEEVEYTDKGGFWEVDMAIKTEEEEGMKSDDDWENIADSDHEGIKVAEKPKNEKSQGGEVYKAAEVKEEEEDVAIDEDDFDGDDNLSVNEDEFFE